VGSCQYAALGASPLSRIVSNAQFKQCRQRPGSRRAAEQRHEFAAFHSITSSARAVRAARTPLFAPHDPLRRGGQGMCGFWLQYTVSLTAFCLTALCLPMSEKLARVA
jgi:hypothetical protein